MMSQHYQITIFVDVRQTKLGEKVNQFSLLSLISQTRKNLKNEKKECVTTWVNPDAPYFKVCCAFTDALTFSFIHRCPSTYFRNDKKHTLHS